MYGDVVDFLFDYQNLNVIFSFFEWKQLCSKIYRYFIL